MRNLLKLPPNQQIKLDEKNSPLSLIKEQANYLTAATNSKLVAEVGLAQSNGEQNMRPFILKVPTMYNYIVTLFTFSHPLAAWYPLTLTFSLEKETVTNPINGTIMRNKTFVVNNDAELEHDLEFILNHQNTHATIQVLLEQELQTHQDEV